MIGMKYRHVATITPAELLTRLEGGEQLTIVDVREDDEVARGIIPQAHHISLRDLPEQMTGLDPDRETILVCRSGRRSLIACKVMMISGFENVKNMTGGMLEWSGATLASESYDEDDDWMEH
jgi:rhodanese-related sulfurtransferase